MSALNLKESNYPIILKKELLRLEGIEDLGELKGNISTNITFIKEKESLIYVKGTVQCLFRNSCDRCLRPTQVEININLKTMIKDITKQGEKEKNNYDFHYQDLQNFKIETLLKEELFLNFPDLIYCNKGSCVPKKILEEGKKIRPFKKIRDLID